MSDSRKFRVNFMPRNLFIPFCNYPKELVLHKLNSKFECSHDVCFSLKVDHRTHRLTNIYKWKSILNSILLGHISCCSDIFAVFHM